MLANAVDVLANKKSWIGYSRTLKTGFGQMRLPGLKPGIIGVNGLPFEASVETEDGLFILDQLYARDYSPFQDLYLITKGYKWLGT